VQSGQVGSLELLPSGGVADNPPALLGGTAMRGLLEALAESYDYVLIDAPPPLEVSDAIPLLHLVDGIILVARVGHTRDLSAERLMQLLARTTSAPVLGLVANCATRKDAERHGLYFTPAVKHGGFQLSRR
jgi:Mrp family chromosome partitioning ATPase